MLRQFEIHLSNLALAPATIVNYLADLRAFLRWSRETNGAARAVLQLDPSDVQAYCDYLRQIKSRAPTTINRRLQALRKFYDFVVEQGWAEANPASDVPLLSDVASRRSPELDGADVARLLDVVQQSASRWADRDWAIVQVFLRAGLKLGELTELCLGDVCLEADDSHLEVGEGAGGPSRAVPLDGPLCEALRRHLSSRRAAPGVDHLFVNRDGQPLSARSVQRLLRHYARDAGLERLTTQALRYEYARRLYETCNDLETVAGLLGHRHLATTARYLRLDSDGAADS